MEVEKIGNKLEIIERIEEKGTVTDSDLKILEVLSWDEDDVIRARVAEMMVSFKTNLSEEILKRLLNDNAELVRVNACDSLYFSESVEVLELLKKRINEDKSSLVRGYATLTLADIAKNIDLYKDELRDFLFLVLQKEKVKWVKIHIYKAMYLLGDESYLDMIIKELNNKNYRNRCATVNILGDILIQNNSRNIIESLIKRIKVEKSNAVKSAIEKIIQKHKA